MMPWEHVLAGYIGYSLFVHAAYRDSPTSRETLVVVSASLLPDLIDKPLAWELGVFASGYAIGHSIFFALLLSTGVEWFASVHGTWRTGRAFSVGYFLHLPSDLLPEYLLRGDIRLDWVLWPVRRGGSGYESGFAGEFRANMVEYIGWVSTQMVSDSPSRYFVVVLGAGIIGVLLWIYDGMPVGRDAVRMARRGLRTLLHTGRK